MASIDQQFVEYIVKSLVNEPDKVEVERTIDERGVLLSLTVDPEDLGRVIGKRGSTAQSIRTLLRALGTKNDARYNLKIIDPEGGRPPRRDDDSKSEGSKSKSEKETDDKPKEEAKEDKKSAKKDEKPKEEDQAPVTVDETETESNEEPEEKKKDSLADKTRKELAELDDLDI